MKASSPVVTRAGHISGMNTLKMIWCGFAPSTIAASSISIGRSRMKVVSTQTVNGRVKIMYARISDQQVVVEAEPANQLEQARENRDLREHRHREDGEEQQRPAPEAHPRQGIGRGDRQEQRQHDDRERRR